MDAGTRAGDDDVDSEVGTDPPRGGNGNENRGVCFHFDRQRGAFGRLPKHAYHREQSPQRDDGLADDAMCAKASHGVRDAGAHDAKVSVAIEMGNESSFREFQSVDAREGFCHAVNDAPPQIPSGVKECAIRFDPGRRLHDRGDGVREENRIGENDAPPRRDARAVDIADGDNVGSQRLELGAGRDARDFRYRDHRYDRTDSDHDSGQCKHRSQLRAEEAAQPFPDIDAHQDGSSGHR